MNTTIRRRGFVQAGLALVSISGSVGFSLQARASMILRAPVKAVIERNDYSGEAFVSERSRLAGEVVRFPAHEIGSLWFETLEPAMLSKTGLAFVGFSRLASLQVLEAMASTHGRAALIRVEHRPTEGGGIEHRVNAPESWLPMLADALRSSTDWQATLHPLLVRAASLPLSVDLAELRIKAVNPSPLREAFVSWVLCTPSRA